LISDLFFADFLIVSNFASSITFQVKYYPTFVSDVTFDDFHQTLNSMKTSDNIHLQVIQFLKKKKTKERKKRKKQRKKERKNTNKI